MQTITVTHPSGTYPIYLGENALTTTGLHLAELGYQGRCLVVTNQAVGQHHAGPLMQSLQAANFEPTCINIPDGEQYKTLETVAMLYEAMLSAKLDRRSIIIALGGGVLGDSVGFAAASFMRGVPLVQIPTTLLSMVDSSVGGKTGVDLPQGKNLVGAFKQPEMVIIDPTVLATLPDAEFRSGMGEVVKHGIIEATRLFSALEQGGTGFFPASLLPKEYTITQMLYDAIQVKVHVVEQDPFEQGRRAVLNLGHTFGHAFEKLANFNMRHGEGVAMGVACAARLATRLGYCAATDTQRIIATLRQVGLPTHQPDYAPEAVWAAMFTDKKRQGNRLRFILPRAIGDVDIFTNIPQEDVLAVLGQRV